MPPDDLRGRLHQRYFELTGIGLDAEEGKTDLLLAQQIIMAEELERLFAHALTQLPGRVSAAVSAEALEPIRRTVASAALAPIAWLKMTIAGLMVCICALAGLGVWGYVQGTGLITAQQRQLNASQEQLSAIAADRAAAGKVQAEADLLREQQQLAAAAKAEAARKKQEAAAAAERRKQEEEKARAAQAEAARARQAYNECRQLRAPYENHPGIDPGLFYMAYPECEAILRKER